MRQPPRSAGAILTVVLLGLPAAFSWAQPPGASVDATDVTSAEIESLLEIIGDSVDLQAKVVDVGRETNVAVGVLLRHAMDAADGPIRGLVHHDVTEVYYVLEGSGVLVTGGTFEAEREFPADSKVVTELVGPSAGGTTEGGTSRVIAAGDVVVIPAGVFHAFSRIDDEIRYLSIRVDPGRKLPAGFVHPALEN